MIGLWSGFHKHLSLTERSDSQVILTHERFHTSDPKAGDIVRVNESGYFKIVGEPKFNDKNGNDWFEVEIGRRVKTKEVRRRTRQRYQLKNLRNWYAMCEGNSDTDGLEIIDCHIKLCMEDKSPDAALVGWVRCMQNVTEGNLEGLKRLRADSAERRRQTAEYGMAELAKQSDAEIKEWDYRIEAESALLEWKHFGLCAHAWDCDE